MTETFCMTVVLVVLIVLIGLCLVAEAKDP